jgi:hypothetical protein
LFSFDYDKTKRKTDIENLDSSEEKKENRLRRE